jgi:hypothetical protein
MDNEEIQKALSTLQESVDMLQRSIDFLVDQNIRIEINFEANRDSIDYLREYNKRQSRHLVQGERV